MKWVLIIILVSQTNPIEIGNYPSLDICKTAQAYIPSTLKYQGSELRTEHLTSFCLPYCGSGQCYIRQKRNSIG